MSSDSNKNSPNQELEQELDPTNPAGKASMGIIVDASEAGRKLVAFLGLRLESMPNCNTSVFQKWIRSGQVRVNSGRSKPYDKLNAGDLVRVPPFAMQYVKQNQGESIELYAGLDLPYIAKMHTPEDASHLGLSDLDDLDVENNGESEAEPLFQSAFQNEREHGEAAKHAPSAKIIAVEDDILVLLKASGLAVQPGSGLLDSLSERLAHYFAGSLFVPAPAHRLDKGASGLLVCGRNQKAQQALHALLNTENEAIYELNDDDESIAEFKLNQQKSSVQREYLVWVSGEADFYSETLLSDYLFKDYDPQTQHEFINTGSPENGSYACCLVQTLQVKNFGERGVCSLLKVQLLSGRKHQIRVQLSSRGHPVVGDPKYGGMTYHRLLLHSFRLVIPAESGLKLSKNTFQELPDWTGAWKLSDRIWDELAD